MSSPPSDSQQCPSMQFFKRKKSSSGLLFVSQTKVCRGQFGIMPNCKSVGKNLICHPEPREGSAKISHNRARPRRDKRYRHPEGRDHRFPRTSTQGRTVPSSRAVHFAAKHPRRKHVLRSATAWGSGRTDAISLRRRDTAIVKFVRGRACRCSSTD